MTENEWLTLPGPWHMLEWVQETASPRKLRLFGCACVRRVLHLIPDSKGRAAVLIAEGFADAQVSPAERREAHIAASIPVGEWQRGTAYTAAHARLAAMAVVEDDPAACWDASTEATKAARASLRSEGVEGDAVGPERQVQAVLFRDIFGNPFRPVAVDPAWLTSGVVALATGIYADRAFDRLPILADALQDAGCENDDLLNHLRSPGPHVLGCWALDLVLGKP